MNKPKIIIGLGFGDEGKGMAVAHETQKMIDAGLTPNIVRFNGGPQAAHNVRVRRNGEILHHTHSQFGSGALLGTSTYITKGMLFDVLAFGAEADHISKLMGKDMRSTVWVDARCPVILPIHVIANRILERRNHHGSTGNGIGIARACEDASDAEFPILRVSCLFYAWKTELYSYFEYWTRWIEKRYDINIDCDEDLWDWTCLIKDTFDRELDNGLNVLMNMDGVISGLVHGNEFGVVFEGSQGMLLDKRHGWFPHVTYGDMDAFDARRMCGNVRPTVLGVTRSYMTRHGNGPFPVGHDYVIDEIDNKTTEWAGKFRAGILDIPAIARTAQATCCDEIAVSHMDKYPGRCVTHWEGWRHEDGVDRSIPCDMHVESMSEDDLLTTIHDACMADVTVVGNGPTLDDWHDREG